MTKLTVGQSVIWLDCPPSIAMFAQTKITKISDDGKLVRVEWIRHPIKSDRVKPCQE